MNYTWKIVIVLMLFIAGCGQVNDSSISQSGKENVEIDGCKIEDPDPDGYLLKICEYLKQHKDDIDIAPADPAKYKIKSIIKDGEYFRYEGEKEVTTKAIVVNLDCCYMGDTAYFDKKTKEIIGFHVGDL